MSYTIGQIFYGVVCDEDTPTLRQALLDVYGDNEVKAERAGWDGQPYENESVLNTFGIVLGEIDETETIKIAWLPTVTPKVKAAYKKKLAKLPVALRNAMAPPQLLIVWCHS